MPISNDLNISQEGVVYFNGTNTFSGIDGSTVGRVMTSNGTDVAPSFQTLPAIPIAGQVLKITNPGAYPYTTLTTDYIILVDSSVLRSIVPLASPTTGTAYVIKDSVGTSGTNPITVTPSGKNIDGAASYVLSSNYGSINIVYNGTEWNIF